MLRHPRPAADFGRGSRIPRSHGAFVGKTDHKRLVLLLILALLARSGSGWLFRGKQPSPIVKVGTPAALVRALGDHHVTTIEVTQDIFVPPDAWPAALIHIRRNLTVQSPLGAQRLLNFTRARVVEKLLVHKGVHLTFQRLFMTGTSVGSYLGLFSASPGSSVWLRDSVWKAPVCPTPVKARAILFPQPRPPDNPGYQRLWVEWWPHCTRRLCYKRGLRLGDWASHNALVSVPTGARELGPYTANYVNVLWICDIVFSDACVAKQGYTHCRTEASEQHAAGQVHAFPSWIQAAVKTAAALACVGAAAAVAWVAAHRPPKPLLRNSSGSPSLSRSTSVRTSRLSAEGRPCDRTLSHPQLGSGQLGGSSHLGSGPLQRPRSQVLPQNALDHVDLGPFLGAGSFGRVYSGLWQGRRVAVKVVPHDKQASDKIADEAALALALCHPNVVRTLHHFTLVEEDPALLMHGPLRTNSLPRGSLLRATTCEMGSNLTQFSQFSAGSNDSGVGMGMGMDGGQTRRTWIVMELCDRGPLSSHLKVVKANSVDQQIDMGLVLGYALDIAQGMAYLHFHDVCHGDLKACNALIMSQAGEESSSSSSGRTSTDAAPLPPLPPLQHARTSLDLPSATASALSSRAQSLSGVASPAHRLPPHHLLAAAVPLASAKVGVAKVSDFGLSRVMASNRTHLSTQTIGTITHMPPELLMDGKLTRECDLYSYGILMWEIATGTALYSRMNPIQIMNKVLIEKARPVFPSHVGEEYVNLARECWAHEVAARPTFTEVVLRLEGMMTRWIRSTRKAALTAERSSEGQRRGMRRGSLFPTPDTPPPAPTSQ